jgi:hypothetical protein
MKREAGWGALTLLAVLAFPLRGAAQDTHYWTFQYGTRSTLLGGTVVGSVLDLSGTFYNPGGLALIKEPETLLAAKTIEYADISLKGFAGDSHGRNSTRLRPSPTMLAGRLKIRGLGRSWFGYSILSRQAVNMRLWETQTEVMDVMPGLAGDETIAKTLRLDEYLIDTWFGLTWAYKVTDTLGIGVTQYVTYRGQYADAKGEAEALAGAGALASISVERRYNYFNWRVLWKIGATFDVRGLTFGITLTTPSLRIFGSGRTGIDIAGTNLALLGGDGPDTSMAFDDQDRLRADYRTPVSVGAGTTLKIRNVEVFLSAEWFAPIRYYNVLAGRDFLVQSTGELSANRITQELESVLNYGLGLEYGVTPKFKLYGSFTTDFSAAEQGTRSNHSVTDWDILHVSWGTALTIKRFSLTTGLGYAFGRSPTSTKTGIFREAADVLQEFGTFSTGSFGYRSLRLLMGISF